MSFHESFFDDDEKHLCIIQVRHCGKVCSHGEIFHYYVGPEKVCYQLVVGKCVIILTGFIRLVVKKYIVIRRLV